VLAAGAVLWRPSRKHGVRVAIVHRPRYDDWSLPKGKSTRGETLAMTAAREVTEETGFDLVLGRRVTTVTYPVASALKTVQYFAARVQDGRFRPGKEVDAIEWVPLRAAKKRLNYTYDRAVIDIFAQIPADLSTLLLVRHARAGQQDGFDGADADRPLDDRGQRQATRLVAELAPFLPSAVHSAPLARCRQTVGPLAKTRRLKIADEPLLTEAEYQHDPASARRRITELALPDTDSGAVVVCSQGGVIPGVVKSLASRGGVPLPTAATPKGAYWLLSFDGKELVQADRYPAPEA
jgi:8-oxo-dGTP diphosphatase